MRFYWYPFYAYVRRQGHDAHDALAGQFYLDGEKDKATLGTLIGNVLTLKLREPSTTKKLTYLKESAWSQEKLVIGTNGIAALSFCDVPIGTR